MLGPKDYGVWNWDRIGDQPESDKVLCEFGGQGTELLVVCIVLDI